MEYIIWNVKPTILSLGNITVTYYGILFVTGLILSIKILEKLFVKEKIPAKNLDNMVLLSIFLILAGARLVHCLFYEPSYYFSNILEIFLPIKISADNGIIFTGYRGLASHGGTLGLIIALFIISKKSKIPLIRYLDLVGIVAPLAASFIRLGNLMNSEIIGKKTIIPWAFIFKKVDNVPRHPAQIYEALAYLIIFSILISIYYKNYRKHHFKNGYFFGSSIILIFISRFLIEFIKKEQTSYEIGLPLNMGQLLSIPYIILGILLIINAYKKNREEEDLY